jgi:uncharacterized protein (DUF433 family)
MATTCPAHTHRTTHDSAILAGKPVIRGTRLPVAVILEDLVHNPNFDELFADEPRLTMDDVKAALAYARRLVRTKSPIAPPRR